ncbi:MAG: outer membrane protein transport protein [Desulfobacterales bacterium]
MRHYRWCGVVLVVWCVASSAGAAGFSVFTQGAKALGQANAVIAHSDSPSTLFYNPAIMNDLPGTQFEIGTTLIYDDRDFNSDRSGRNTAGKSNANFPSTLYATHAVNDWLSAGIGVFNPFGLSTEWPDDWEGRFIATKSELTTYVINPAVSVRVAPWLSLAAGVDFMILDGTLKRRLNLNQVFPFGEGKQEFSGDDTAWGFNLGLFAKLTDRLHLGMSYRSKYDATLDGDVKNKLPASADPIAGLFPKTNGSVDLDLPDQFLAGLAYHFSDRFVMEAGIRYEGWSRYEQLKLELDDPIAGQDSQISRKDYRDTYGVMVGGKYQVSDSWALMAGYLYEKGAIPGKTFEPSNPDSDSHVFSLGTSYRFKRFEASFAYAFQKEVEKEKDNDIGADTGFPANGDYDSNLHLVAMSLGYKF